MKIAPFAYEKGAANRKPSRTVPTRLSYLILGGSPISAPSLSERVLFRLSRCGVGHAKGVGDYTLPPKRSDLYVYNCRLIGAGFHDCHRFRASLALLTAHQPEGFISICRVPTTRLCLTACSALPWSAYPRFRGLPRLSPP